MSAKKKPAKKSKVSSKVSPLAPESGDVPIVTGTVDDYERFLPAAMKIAKGDVVPFRADASLAHYNVSLGLAAVLADEAQVRKALPGADISALRQLPSLALAVAYAVTQHVPEGPRGVATLVKAASESRTLLLSSAQALAKAKLLPQAKIDAIVAGKGKRDLAEDCIALAALFAKSAAAIKGKHAVSASDVRAADANGRALLTALLPKGARRTKSAEATSSADVRDRLWTLLEAGFEDLWKAGAQLFGRDVDAHVPPIQSRTHAAKKKAKPPAVAGASAGSSPS